MAKFNAPREPFRPGEPARKIPGTDRPSRIPTALNVPEPWAESSFDLRQGLDVIENTDLPPAPAEPPGAKRP